MQMISLCGSGRSVTQVGAFLYSAGGILSEAISFPNVPTASMGAATGAPEPPEPSAVGNDQLVLSSGLFMLWEA
jgi:hypothetical protein